ncbi:sensor histidine kinase, partial [Eubacterium sp.]
EYVISDAITTLGNMFRYSMKWSSGMVELKQEILNIQNYLSLMNLRQDYEIFLSLNVPAELLHIKIPKMSLQPIVENSVNHGIEEMAEDTTIYIKVFKEENNVIIEVSDMGIGMSQEKLNELIRSINSKEQISDDKEHGRALYNVQQRIKMYFGKEYGLQIFSQEGAYTKVSICIPNDETL